MGIYSRHVLPRLTHMAMRQEQLKSYRQRLVSGVEGRVLEIGMGSGLNLPFYSANVTEVIGLDPSAALLRIAGDARGAAPELRMIEGVAEAIPLDDASVDHVVVAWTLCSVSQPFAALEEARRTLKPGGRLHFVEHGRAPEPAVQRWQQRLTPIWRRCAGNCHLDRPVVALIEGSGFKIERLSTGYAAGPRPMTFMYEGAARSA